MSSETIKADLSIKAEINLYYDLYAPDNIRKPAPLLIAVHGYGAHKRYMMREARAIAPDGFVIASLQGPYQHFRPTPEGYRVGLAGLQIIALMSQWSYITNSSTSC
jgi:predicted esterase